MEAKAQKKPISEARAWCYVIIGGILEIIWASGFKYESINGAIVLGMIFFKEPRSLFRVACIVGIIFAVMGLKLTS
ncbi:hypothetical protein [Paenibacillus herberti]|uniref:QacE family quaternary ammonium compound efflux SMR transporter n=1 Tax=Paenibacillus herberti TaxID=1619309 RepID=A0A229NY15_9BACL|nr:hypothetical protein [Paenibacillus herberti]OXM14788.1 hypothetical protein CGZ75_18120 [Paenibacillus herberti]